MMKNGLCPKCQGTNIYTNHGAKTTYGERSNLAVSAFHSLLLDVYICTDCRYMEEYINDDQSLDKLKSKWNKV